MPSREMIELRNQLHNPIAWSDYKKKTGRFSNQALPWELQKSPREGNLSGEWNTAGLGVDAQHQDILPFCNTRIKDW